MTDIGQTIIGAVRAAAEKNPQYIYDGQSCVYVRDGGPSCLLGHALWELDLIDPSLEKLMVNAEDVGGLLYHLKLELDKDEEDWLETVQGGQDGKIAWGRVVAFADEDIDEAELTLRWGG